jgi:hypothetical protein
MCQRAALATDSQDLDGLGCIRCAFWSLFLGGDLLCSRNRLEAVVQHSLVKLLVVGAEVYSKLRQTSSYLAAGLEVSFARQLLIAGFDQFNLAKIPTDLGKTGVATRGLVEVELGGSTRGLCAGLRPAWH